MRQDSRTRILPKVGEKMPLKKGKSNRVLRNHFSKLNVFDSIFSFSPVVFMVAICTKYFEIFNRVVCSIGIDMMNHEHVNIINTTTIADNFTMKVNRSCKTFWNVCFFRFQGSINKSCTRSRTIFFNPTLKCSSPNNYSSAKLARMALNAR